jgi:hypothetical protein
MNELSTTLPLPPWVLIGRGETDSIAPPDLVERVTHVALENWGETVDAKRGHVEAMLRADLGFRASRQFNLGTTKPDVLRHRLETIQARLALLPDQAALRRAVLEFRARRLGTRVAEADARARLAVLWRDHVLDLLMAMYDLEFLRGRQAAARSNASTGLPPARLGEDA